MSRIVPSVHRCIRRAVIPTRRKVNGTPNTTLNCTTSALPWISRSSFHMTKISFHYLTFLISINKNHVFALYRNSFWCYFILDSTLFFFYFFFSNFYCTALNYLLLLSSFHITRNSCLRYIPYFLLFYFGLIDRNQSKQLTYHISFIALKWK